MSDPAELKLAYVQMAEALDPAIRELELKAAILKRIQGSLYHQASSASDPDLVHTINPENLFSTIRSAIQEYERHK